MIVGLGIDMCDRRRVSKAIERHGDRFCRRVLVDAELQDLHKHANKSAFVARRIAAKEAVVKALGTGIAAGVGWQQVCVSHTASGQPIATLTGAASQLLEDLGMARVHLSITDEKDYAAAVAVIESSV